MFAVIAVLLLLSIILQITFINISNDIKTPIKPGKKPAVFGNPYGYQPTSNPPRTPPTRRKPAPPPAPPSPIYPPSNTPNQGTVGKKP